MFKLSFLLFFSVLLACSDDSNPAENNSNNSNSNNETNQTNQSNNQTNTNNSTTPTNNATNSNNSTQLPADIVEAEPNNELESATRVSVGQSFGGNISAGSGQNADMDVFVLSLEAGTILELEFLDIAQNLQPEIEFSDEEGAIIRYLNPTTSDKRQVFIPADGDYYVGVYDVRSEQQHGGDSATYVVQTRIAEPTLIDLDAPATVTGNTSSGNVDVYRVIADTTDVLVFETFGSRTPGQGDIDTVLIAYSPEAGLIDFNDDIDVDGENYDSMVAFRPEADNSYLIVVDMWEVQPTNGYTLVSTTSDDDLTAPSPISVGGTFEGVIEDRGDDDFDTDFFEVTLNAGEVGRFEVEANGDMVPTISVYIDTALGFFSIADSLPVGGTAAVEFGNTIEEAGTFYILVDDLRNVPFEGEAENVGGETFTYIARLNLATWEPLFTTLPNDVLGSVALGTYAWYDVEIPANSVLVANVATGADFEPILASYEAGVDQPLDEPLAPFFNFTTATRQLAVGVRDIYFRGGATYDFSLNFSVISIEAVTFVDAMEVEPNDTLLTAQDLVLPAALKGATEGSAIDTANEDWFAMELTAGTPVLAYTGPGSEVSANADTILEVYSADGTLITQNDDYEGQVDTYFSGLVFLAPADGTYYLKVVPYCSSAGCDNGEYVLYITN